MSTKALHHHFTMAACLVLTGYDWLKVVSNYERHLACIQQCFFYFIFFHASHLNSYPLFLFWGLQTTAFTIMIYVTLSSQSWCSKVTGRQCHTPSLSTERKLFLRKSFINLIFSTNILKWYVYLFFSPVYIPPAKSVWNHPLYTVYLCYWPCTLYGSPQKQVIGGKKIFPSHSYKTNQKWPMDT